jgi:RHS repeat-associated protein
MNHLQLNRAYTHIRSCLLAASIGILVAVFCFVPLESKGQTYRCCYNLFQGIKYWHNECLNPQFTVVLAEGSESIPSGTYYVFCRRNSGSFGKVLFTINDDRSISAVSDYTGLGGGPVEFCANPDDVYTISTDGNLYTSAAGTKVVGSVSGGITREWVSVGTCSGVTLVGHTEYIKLTVSINPDCKKAQTDPGTQASGLNSLHFSIGLGRGTNSHRTGVIELLVPRGVGNMATPTLLSTTPGCPMHTITDGNGLRQVLSEQVLADIVTNNSYQYEVRLYKASDAGVFTNGLYQTTNSPFKVFTFKNPDGSTNHHRLWVTSLEGSVTNETQFTYDTNSTAFSTTWEILYPGLRKEVLTKTYSSDFSNQTNLWSVYQPGSPDVLVYEERTRYFDFGWGQEIVEQVIDPNGSGLTNSWEYYTSPGATGDYRRLKERREWNGFWERFDYDTQGRETNRTTVFLNATNGSPSDMCRSLNTSYSSTAPHITRVETLLGHEISRTYMAHFAASNAVKVVRCQTPGASWTDSGNLVSITSRDSYYQPTNVWNADGTRTFYTYVTNGDNSITTTRTAGQTNGPGTAIAEGMKNIIVVGSAGQTISNISINITAGSDGPVLSRDTYFYEETDYAYSTPTIGHLDGTQTSGGGNGCCGSPNLGNELAKDGTITSHVYDALLRRVSSTLNSIISSNIFDPLGNQIVSMRIGTDSSVITNSQATYDLAGRLISTTDALGAVTTVTNAIGAEGQLIKTNTYADGSTRIETYFRDGSLESVTGTAVFPVRYRYSVEDDGEGLTNSYAAEVKLGASGSDTNEWVKTFRDMIGRNYKTVYASSTTNFPFSKLRYNNLGQLTNQVDPDGISVLYTYNPKGELACTVMDSNRNFTIQYSGDDRITYVTNDVVNNGTAAVRRTRTYVWNTSADSSKLVSTVETSADGLRSWNTIWNNGVGVTSQSRTVYDAANGYRYITNSAPDGSYTVFTTRYGTNVSLIQYDSANSQLSATTFAHDSHGRLNRVTDARNGTTTNYFNNADQVNGMATPAPAPGQSSQVTSNFFDILGRISGSILPDSTTVTNEYFLTGLLKKTSGARTYPVEYTYDYAGRMKTMQTWTNFPNNNTATTTWTYDAYRGFLTGKTYDGGASGPSYTYTDAGRLRSRTWARGVGTTNSYNHLGELSEINYTDNTPDVTYGYNRLGQILTVTHDSSVCTYVYNDVGLLLSDSTTGGVLNGLSVTNGYDSLLRRTNLVLNSASGRLASTTNDFDIASRLNKISDGTNSATYSYLVNSPLVSQVVFSNSTALRLTTAKAYDFLNRLTNITSTPSGSSAVSFKYGHNSANQRTTVTNADNSRWTYTYDSLGQVTSGKKYWSDNTSVAGQQFEYEFDTIGNRKTAKSGGDAAGANLRTANYSANGLNQYTGRTVPGAVDILGSANSSATVTVNNHATYRKGDYYRYEMSLDNSSSAVWSSVTNVAVLNDGSDPDIVTTTIGNVFLVQTNEAFGYDADGNMTSDGRWTYMWDAENRLTNMTSQSSSPSGSKFKLDFAYDYHGRRTQKIVSAWNGTNYVAQSTNRFVYDGWNLIAILDSDFAIQTSFVWGLDLSGSYQGAGGVGGLLAINEITSGTHFTTFDANGNVMTLIRANDGTTSANYEYNPFGDLIKTTGETAKRNPFTFSTKYQDDHTDLLYYGYRYYNSKNGTWISRDRLGENGGPLYAFVLNQATLAVDLLGNQFFIPANQYQVSQISPYPAVPVSRDIYFDPVPSGMMGDSQGDSYNDALDLYEAWREGLLPPHSYFYSDSAMTEDVMGFQQVDTARQALINRVKSEPCTGKKFVSYRQPILGTWNNPFRVMASWNVTRQFLGTFSGDILFTGSENVDGNGCCIVSGTLLFHVRNTTSRESYWRHYKYVGAPLPTNVSDGPYANNTQHYLWQERVDTSAKFSDSSAEPIVIDFPSPMINNNLPQIHR